MLQRIDDAKLTAGQSDGLVPVFRIMRIPERLSQVFDRLVLRPVSPHVFDGVAHAEAHAGGQVNTFQTGMG